MNTDKSLATRHSSALSAKSVESANALLNLREKISQNTALVSDEWLDRLIKWADEKNLLSQKSEFMLFKYSFFRLPEWKFEPFYREYFPRDKDELRKCNGLSFQWCNFDDLPDEFGNLAELEFLYIGEINKIPSSILRLKKLKVLGLNNYFANEKTEISLSKEFARLSNLEFLTLDSHYFKHFPSAILELNKLRGLSLRGCGLSTLPERFACLQNLQTLFLSRNDFKEFPQVIFGLKNLKELSIDKHLITPKIDKKLQEMGVNVSSHW